MYMHKKYAQFLYMPPTISLFLLFLFDTCRFVSFRVIVYTSIFKKKKSCYPREQIYNTKKNNHKTDRVIQCKNEKNSLVSIYAN